MSGRRLFLGTLAGAGALATLGVCRLMLTTNQQAVVAVLRKRLDYLKLDDSDLHRFADDLTQRNAVSGPRLRVLAAAGPLYSHVSLAGHDPISNGVRHGEERVVTYFLLSSDFFRNGKDISRPVRYIGFYDPFQACGSPFARPIGYVDTAPLPDTAPHASASSVDT